MSKKPKPFGQLVRKNAVLEEKLDKAHACITAAKRICQENFTDDEDGTNMLAREIVDALDGKHPYTKHNKAEFAERREIHDALHKNGVKSDKKRLAEARAIFQEADPTHFEDNALASHWYERLKDCLAGKGDES